MKNGIWAENIIVYKKNLCLFGSKISFVEGFSDNLFDWWFSKLAFSEFFKKKKYFEIFKNYSLKYSENLINFENWTKLKIWLGWIELQCSIS